MIASSVSHDLLDQFDRNQLKRLYSAHLPRLFVEQRSLSDEFNRATLTSTYRDELLGHGTHGDLTHHYGNCAHDGAVNSLNERAPLKNVFLNDYTKTASSVKPFLAPSYQNLTQSEYMVPKMIKNYSNNYRTSEDNVSFKRLNSDHLPQKTTLPQFFKMSIKPIGLVDKASVYSQEALNGHVNDYFHSKKYVKSEMMNVRDNFASAMQFFDYLRNKRFDSNTRKLFGREGSDGTNEIDVYSEYFTQLIGEIKNMLRYMDSLKSRALDLKRMIENLSATEKIVLCNLLDFHAKPVADRRYHAKSETSIHQDKKVIVQAKEFGYKVLAESQLLINAMKTIGNDIVNNVLEEVKIIYLEKIDNKAYQREYVRDSNGYMKADRKMPLSLDAWKRKAENVLFEVRQANENANRLIHGIKETIDALSGDVSKQVMSTHEVVKNQIEDDLKAQGVLATHQKDLRRELSEMNAAIADTTRKLGTCQILDEVGLTQLTQPMPNIDMVDEGRKRKIEKTNHIWSCATDLRLNLADMVRHKQILEDTIVKNDKALRSSHSGIDYDWRTVANPRRHNTAALPAVGLVNHTFHTFF